MIGQAELLRAKLYSSHYWSEEFNPIEYPRRGLDHRLIVDLQLLDDDTHNESNVLRVCLTGLIESGLEVIRRARAGDRKYVKREGDAWNLWIVCITLIAQAFKLPVGIRREVYRVAKGEKPGKEPSPFVEFIKALQIIACPDYHASASDGGLAKAIGRARQSIEVPQSVRVADSVETDALELLLLKMFGITSYSQLKTLEPSPLEQAVRMVTESDRPGVHPFIPEIT